jgi:pimeloyl-ACP methyl ester carboxylesterase
MIRFITYLIISIFGIAVSIAQVKSEEITIKNDSIQLPGTLTFSAEKSPLIIWVHGSGNVDRNGNQMPIVKANYIKQLRDSVNKEGISFFSYDKRTANKNNVAVMMKNGVNFKDFAVDVKTVVSHFKKDTRFTKITLIGHSQGSLVAMLASKDVDKYISLAGPSKSADKAIIKQIKEKAPFLDSINRAHFKELKETGNVKTVNPMLVSIFAKPNQSFLNSWIQYNPSKEIKKINIPTLIINGDKDLQVPISDAEELKKASPKSELVIIKNMNHVLKDIQKDKDNLASYYSADFKLSKKLIETIVSFVKK